jgi:type IV pilus assembly protein PilE
MMGHTMTTLQRSRQRGFTLMELLIVIAILGIIAAVAIPNYSQYVMRSRRAQAASCLQEYAQYMERVYSSTLTYVGSTPLPDLGCANENRLKTYYTITAPTVAQRNYTLLATPLGAQLSADTTCGKLQLASTGARSTPDHPDNVTKCF